MFGIALSATACLRAGTRVDIAWVVDGHPGGEFDPADAVAMTPGGGRLGSLLAGALDGQLDELAGVGERGRLVRLDITPADAAISGVAPTSGVGVMLVPGSELPEDLWDRLLAREPVGLVCELDGDEVVTTSLYTSESIAEAAPEVQKLFEMRSSATWTSEDRAATALWPKSTIVVVGGGEIASSLGRVAAMLGWNAVLTADASEATGVIATLSPLDGVVVAGHDLELTGRSLMAALSGNAGYIGAVGPRSLQESRADWLAYRGHTDLSRVQGPAGLDIGARTPPEVALAIAAEIVADQRSSA